MQLLAIGATGPIYSLQYAHCNQCELCKKEVEQDFLEKPFDTFGR